jgi:hypothetical protein
MTKCLRLGRVRISIFAALVVIAIAGCATRGDQVTSEARAPNQVASAKEAAPVGPPPSALSDQCLWVGGSTPANWICNGKPYTQHKLHQLRVDWEKKQQAHQ